MLNPYDVAVVRLPIGNPWAPVLGSMIPHGHLPVAHYDYDFGMGNPYWGLDPYVDRCCDFCDAWQEIVRHSRPLPNTPSHSRKAQPDVADLLDELSYYNPHQHAHILQLYDTIHGHYRLGYDRDSPDSYYLSRELEKLSKALQRAGRRSPWSGRGIDDIGSRLKIMMGPGVRVAPRRRKYHTRPRPRYADGSFYVGDYPRRKRSW
jgi:hypothetical protein